MEFEIILYKDTEGNSRIEEFLLELDKSNKILVAKTKQGIEKLRYRFYHKEPLTKYIESDLWELRVKSGNNILRILYTYKKGKIIVLLHIFIKKQQRILESDLEVARNRLKELKKEES